MAKIKVDNPKLVVKEACWLAWQACRGTSGMGALQNRPDANKEDVWNNICTGGLGADYPNAPPSMTVIGGTGPGRVSADYVFGRMMKLRLEWSDEEVKFDDFAPTPDYQAWAYVFPTYQDLIEASVKSLAEEIPF